MRATDLLGSRVIDSDGRNLGRIHDLRFRVEGRPETHDLTLVLVAISCSQITRGHAMGYGSGDMKGPWPLKAIFGRIHSRVLEIPWAEVANHGSGEVRLATASSQSGRQA